MKKLIATALLAVGLTATLPVPQAKAQDPFLGQIAWFAGNFAPRGWALCDGQLLPISSYSALFSLLGTSYGGDGRSTFALPDMRGRTPFGYGNGPGLSSYPIGAKGGIETVTLNQTQIPVHDHFAVLSGAAEAANSTSPQGAALGTATAELYLEGTAPDVSMNAQSIVVGNAGGSIAHDNMMPYGVLNCIIATQGIFPSRS